MWIHVDHHVAVVSHLSVSLFNPNGDPFAKDRPEDSGNHIAYPLLGKLLNINIIWHVVLDLPGLLRKGQDVFGGQVLVLRHIDRLDIVDMDPFLLPTNDVFQKVDGDILYGKSKVSMAKKTHLPIGGR